jgi:hypothetical protein
MAVKQGGVAVIPWYATVFRADRFELALAEIAPVALRYGASDFTVYRMRDDRYRFIQYSTFEYPADFDRYWYGEEFVQWRADYSSWYQVPVVSAWADRVLHGEMGGRIEGRVGLAANGPQHR